MIPKTIHLVPKISIAALQAKLDKQLAMWYCLRAINQWGSGRLAMNMRALKGEEMTGTDTEACAYLYTVSLTQPLDNDWAQIYLLLSTQVVRRNRKTEIPQDIAVEELSDYHMGELRRLKECLILNKAQRQPVHPVQECRYPRSLTIGGC